MKRLMRIISLIILLLPLLPVIALAEEGATPAPSLINSGDTAWLLISTALVMFMTPGLALFYGGMVRRKNVLGTVMHSFIILCVISVLWVVIGYTLAFGPDKAGLIGGLDWFGLNRVGQDGAPLASTVPHLLFMMYQGMFAVITPALITGAFAERIKFSSMLLFTLLWSVMVYSPLAHWVWGGGWIGAKLGALDFAGGTVVHISSATAALVAALVIGRRKGYMSEAMIPHNLPMTITGAAILWFGWFGFNAGSALTSGGLASVAFVTTNTASASAAIGWLLIERIKRGKPTALGAVSGAVAGLVAITPAAGFVTPMSSIIIGLAAGALCYLGVTLKSKLGFDDSLDVVGIHGVGGTWGAIATGLFATTAMNSAGKDGLLYGNPGLVVTQAIAVVATMAFVGIMSFILLKFVDAVMGLRVEENEEVSGLDLSQHGESGYAMY